MSSIINTESQFTSENQTQTNNYNPKPVLTTSTVIKDEDHQSKFPMKSLTTRNRSFSSSASAPKETLSSIVQTEYLFTAENKWKNNENDDLNKLAEKA